jgi:hypothetical protein
MAKSDMVLQWKKLPMTTDVVSRVSPGSSVQLESLVPAAKDQKAIVFQIPELFIRRLLYRIGRRVGMPHAPLLFNSDGVHGPLSQGWKADQRPPPDKPTTYIAAVPGMGLSGTLTVTNGVIFQKKDLANAEASISGAGLAALGGPAVPVMVRAGASREMIISGTAYGIEDPDIELRLIVSTGEKDDFFHFLEEYLAVVGETFVVEDGPAQLWEVVRSEYPDCLYAPAAFSMESVRLTVDEDEAIDVDLHVRALSAGRALAAVAVFDVESGRLISVADLMILQSTNDGSMFIGS